MKFCSVVLSLLGIFVASAHTDKPKYAHDAPARISGSFLAKNKFSGLLESETKENFDTFWLKVPLDYNKPDDQTFEIRYHVDDSNFDGSGEAPIMIAMGQEGTMDAVKCTADMVSNSGICVQIEHR